MLKLTQMHYFVQTVDCGSITQAAKNLFISQPALSKQLSLLEKELNCELFRRKSTGLELTEAGRFFYEKAASIIAEAESLEFSMAAFTAMSTIKIGALPSIGSYFLPQVISRLSIDFKVELVIKDTTAELAQLLEAGQIDFAYVQDADAGREYTVHPLFSEPYDAVIPFTGRKQHAISLEEFLSRTLVLHKHPCDIRKYLEMYCEKHQLAINVLIDLESNTSIIPFVSNGLGASILPRMASRHVESHLVEIVVIEKEQLVRRIDFLYKPLHKKLAKSLIAYSEEACSMGHHTIA